MRAALLAIVYPTSKRVAARSCVAPGGGMQRQVLEARGQQSRDLSKDGVLRLWHRKQQTASHSVRSGQLNITYPQWSACTKNVCAQGMDRMAGVTHLLLKS